MSKILGYLLVLILTVSHSFLAQGQYQSVGTAQQSFQPGKYILTEAKQQKIGAVWHQQKVDLNRSFTWRFYINFGNRPDGADGMTFVLQNQGTKVIGGSGGGLGYNTITPSLGIEFDSYYNKNLNDPPFHHIAIQKNGNVDHASPLNLAGPVATLAGNQPLSDSLDHFVRIEWDAAKKQLTLWVDCEVKTTLPIDLAKEVFGGNASVWWGLAASTGGSGSRHSVSFVDTPLGNRTLVSGCAQETIQLSAPASINNQYSWQPADQLSSPTSKTPTVKLTHGQEFTVSYRNECDLPVSDTVVVDVKPLPGISQSLTSICLLDNQARLEASTSDTTLTYLWPHSGEKTESVTVGQTGSYEVNVTTSSGCTQSQYFAVKDTCGLAAVYLPEAFTPNGDGVNDEVEIKTLAGTSVDLTIYNSWGEVLFQSNSLDSRWDGTYRGQACPAAQYSYVLKYSREQAEREGIQRKQGTITLIR